jgi:hypothetical protein
MPLGKMVNQIEMKDRMTRDNLRAVLNTQIYERERRLLQSENLASRIQRQRLNSQLMQSEPTYHLPEEK